MLLRELSRRFQQGDFEIVVDNAVRPEKSMTESMETPVQLVPFGSSWMKISSCPDKVKQKMQLQTPKGCRWKSSIQRKNFASPLSPLPISAMKSPSFGSLMRSQSDTSIFSSVTRGSAPKIPLRPRSPERAREMRNSAWEAEANSKDSNANNIMNRFQSIMNVGFNPTISISSSSPSSSLSGAAASSWSPLSMRKPLRSCSEELHVMQSHHPVPMRPTTPLSLSEPCSDIHSSRSAPSLGLRMPKRSSWDEDSESSTDHHQNETWDVSNQTASARTPAPLSSPMKTLRSTLKSLTPSVPGSNPFLLKLASKPMMSPKRNDVDSSVTLSAASNPVTASSVLTQPCHQSEEDAHQKPHQPVSTTSRSAPPVRPPTRNAAYSTRRATSRSIPMHKVISLPNIREEDGSFSPCKSPEQRHLRRLSAVAEKCSIQVDDDMNEDSFVDIIDDQEDEYEEAIKSPVKRTHSLLSVSSLSPNKTSPRYSSAGSSQRLMPPLRSHPLPLLSDSAPTRRSSGRSPTKKHSHHFHRGFANLKDSLQVLTSAMAPKSEYEREQERIRFAERAGLASPDLDPAVSSTDNSTSGMGNAVWSFDTRKKTTCNSSNKADATTGASENRFFSASSAILQNARMHRPCGGGGGTAGAGGSCVTMNNGVTSPDTTIHNAMALHAGVMHNLAVMKTHSSTTGSSSSSSTSSNKDTMLHHARPSRTEGGVLGKLDPGYLECSKSIPTSLRAGVSRLAKP